MAVLVQLRVSTIRENTRRGLAHTHVQGRVGGDPGVLWVLWTLLKNEISRLLSGFDSIVGGRGWGFGTLALSGVVSDCIALFEQNHLLRR